MTQKGHFSAASGISSRILRISDNRDGFWQWDTDCMLIAGGIPVGCEVHFFREGLEFPIPSVIYEKGNKLFCNVPDEVLQESKKVHAYAYLMNDEGNRTVYHRTFEVYARAKPSDYVYTPTEILNYHSLDVRIANLEKGGVSDEQIAKAVAKYMSENPVSAGSTATIGVVDLIAAKWKASEVSENLYSQEVTIYEVPENFDFENCQVDLTPSVEQLLVFYDKDLTFATENDGGKVTVFAIGQKPEHDYTIQVTITEVQL